MSEQQRRGVKEMLGQRGGPGQETMYLGIQVGGGASSSYGGWGGGVMETKGLNRGMGALWEVNLIHSGGTWE